MFWAMCVSAFDTIPDPAWHVSKAEKLLAEKSYDSALFHFTTGAKLYSVSNDEATLRAITGAGQCLIRLRKIDEGIALLTPYQKHAEQIDSIHQVREDYYDVMSKLHYYAGDAFTSLKYHRHVLEINNARGNTPAEKQIDLIRIIGVLLGNSGQLKGAIDYYRQYAELTSLHYGPTHLFMSDAYNYLGVMYRHLGEYDLALDYYMKAIEIAEAYSVEERTTISPRFISLAPVYNNVGTVHHNRGDHDNALAFTFKALYLYENDKSASKSSLAAILSSLGTTYTELDRHREALLYKQKAMDMFIAEYGNQHGRIATEMKSIGDTHFALKVFSTAEEYYQRSLDMNLAVHGSFHPNTAEAYAKLASTEKIKGNFDQALKLIQKSIHCLVNNFSSDDIFANPDIDALCNVKAHLIDKLSTKADLMVELFEKTKDVKLIHGAQNTYALAVRFSEVVRNDLLDVRSKAYLAEHSKSLFEKSIRAALLLHELTDDPGYIAFAFDIMEKNKSRLLLESVQKSKVKSTGALDGDLFNKENGLQSQIAFFEENILDEQVKEMRDSAKIKQYERSLFQARRELESFKRTLEKENPRYYQTKYNNREITLPKLRQRLSENELLVEYFAGADALYIFYATREESGILTETPNILADVTHLLNGVRDRNTQIFTDLSHTLYSKILGQIIDLTGPRETIIVVPDGVLAYLPFELLLTAPAGTKKNRDFDYAIRKYNFSYQLSAALMENHFPDRIRKDLTPFAGFAPQFSGEVVASRGLPGNIPYAQREVKEIAMTFPGTIYVGEEATEFNFRQHAGNAELLHLATHASLDENANLSRLYFAAADTTDDGLLHVYEIYNLDLNAKLVTLSACNTGAGAYKEGEGVMSLSRAFAYAGCESMLTSLWPSQDQTTADIMAAFYRNLANGASKDEALRQAKLDFLLKADNIKSDPFYWAGFVLIGDTDPVSEASFVSAAFISTSGVAVLVLSVFAILRLRRRKVALKPVH